MIFVLTNLVGVSLDEHSFLGLLWFSLASVLAELSKWVGLGTGEQSILSCLDILWPPTPCLQAGVLESSGIRERYVPWVGTLVHGVQVEGCLNLRLPTRQELQNTTCFNALVNDFAKAFALELGKWRFSFRKLAMIPGTAGGILLWRSLSVYSATCCGVAFSLHSAPGVTMLGLRRIPSNMTLFSAR